MPHTGKTLILADGGPAALLACACIREGIALSSGAGKKAGANDDAAVLAFSPFVAMSKPRAAALARHAELFSFHILEQTPPTPDAALPEGERESLALLNAAYIAARNGFDRVLWPATSAAGDSLDLDRIAQISDRALLVGRLVAIDGAHHGVPSIQIDTPYADFTDRQIADLLADMELPVESCWCYAAAGDPEAAREAARWTAALASVGWTLHASS